MKIFTDQELITRIEQAPAAVQDTIGDLTTSRMLVELGQRLKLHIDQIGMLAVLNRNMLLGLVSPQEFMQELVASGVAEAVARQIMDEINKTIFVPLQQKMRAGQGGQSVTIAPKPASSAPSIAAPQTPKPPIAQVLGPKMQSMTPPPLRPVPQPPPNLPGAPTRMLEPEKLLNNREEQHIDLKPPVSQPVPVMRSAMPPAQTSSQQQPSAQPAPMLRPAMPIASAPIEPRSSSPAVAPAKPIVKEYSADPYREPIDETK